MEATAEESVRAAEAAYTSLDIDRMMALFDADSVLVWNGEVAARGLAELRRWHEERFADRRDQRMQKASRAVTGQTVAVELHATWTDTTTGRPMESYGGEFWTMNGDRLREWHAYSDGPHVRPVVGSPATS